ncbi:hypothetical protein CCR83_08435 [Rhodobacter veldkampii DSM 11550]|uniref:DGQHR domain-containing protein n=1 Tax=Phaeovulum veldkampii DSM 11550 TaxID=1185920 RepID=A0A2T4JAH0_9RHOB|nr:DGQHR domain-containing protein [Phaeovulum veldkampii]MBK5946456.1 hypothetical protein [Phaeovulum veldkampii DSM 11550]PTE14906.1 hypothetical protein C5F46_14345 [Phaeovulum veldkampii DSM 11550]TDQ53542.1 DNA sulfur modification protein DndB [Phaeovulum veldkampii DSM 11550]
MSSVKRKEITLPALRGIMGDWVYYSCLMSLPEIGARVSYADEIHSNKQLSDMIQRQLNRGRSADISKYLQEQSERFFNSLVIATYDGEPNWYGVSGVKPQKGKELSSLTEEVVSSVGFLTLRGDEKLFAIDGQHRLAGIKKALKGGLDQDPFDEVSVIFVAHNKAAKGLERTRRLFTTLNKTAKPVSKGDIIALDEDDVMAICARHLIENTKQFSGSRIAFVATNNMPATNVESLTTIGNLYDVLTILFTKVSSDIKDTKKNLQNMRPSDERLDEYFEYAVSFFEEMGARFPELGEFFTAIEAEPVVRKHRGNHGGSALYRPLGIDIFVEVIAQLANKSTLSDAIAAAAKLPRTLDQAPYRGLLWDASNRTILNSHKVTMREVILYMVGRSKYTDATLLTRYRKALGDEDAALPAKVV